VRETRHTLSYTPAFLALGAATVTVRAVDDGGTANAGSDTSAPQTFTITILVG
jgi:large repetitive protein